MNDCFYMVDGTEIKFFDRNGNDNIATDESEDYFDFAFKHMLFDNFLAYKKEKVKARYGIKNLIDTGDNYNE